MTEFVCQGLAATHLAAYLAALGLLRTLASVWPGVTLSWRRLRIWTPVLHVPAVVTEAELIQRLEQALDVRATGAPHWPPQFDPGRMVPELFLAGLRPVVAGARLDQRLAADWWAAYGHETVLTGGASQPLKVARPPWVVCNGAGHQELLTSARMVAGLPPVPLMQSEKTRIKAAAKAAAKAAQAAAAGPVTGRRTPPKPPKPPRPSRYYATAALLREALFDLHGGVGVYGEKPPVTRLNPYEAPLAALVAGAPQDDKHRQVLAGQVRLVIEALPWFMLMPDAAEAYGATPAAQVWHAPQERGVRAAAARTAEAARLGGQETSVPDLQALHFMVFWDRPATAAAVATLLRHSLICDRRPTSRRPLQLLGVVDRWLVRQVKWGDRHEGRLDYRMMTYPTPCY